jgi:lysophospholipid acyltransferase
MIGNVLSQLPEDQKRFLGSFLVMLPLGWIFIYLRNPYLRMIYSLIFGLFFQYLVYSSAMLHVIFALVANLSIIWMIPTQYIGRTAIFYNFAHNSIIHLYRLLIDYDNWSIEISVIFMLVMCKFCSFAFCYQDGYYLQSQEKIIQLSKEQIRYSITKFTLLEYVSYIFFFPSSICGPFFEFNDFMNFIYRREEYSNIPNTIIPSLVRMINALLLASIYTLLKSYGDPELIIDEKGQFSTIQKFIFFLVGGVHEMKYLSGFCLQESAIIASGFGFNGYKDDPNHDTWGKVRGVNIINLEMVYDPNQFFKYWNISVHFFLKRYVYFRLAPLGSSYLKQQIANSQTFFVSAFWHGFHPTYFIVFLHFYLYTLLYKQLKSIDKELQWSKYTGNKIPILITRCIILIFLVPYHCLMFVCLDYKRLYNYMYAVYAFGTLLVASLNFILILVRKTFIENKKGKCS